MADDRNWGAEAGIATDALKTWYYQAIKAYKMSLILLVIGTLILIVLGVKLNQTGNAVANFTIAAAFLVIWAFFTFHPAGLLTVFGIGGLNGLPKDWSLNQLLREGKLPDLSLSTIATQGLELIKKYVHYSAHVAYFAIVVFAVLGTAPIKNAGAVLPVFVLLAGIGLWAALSKAVAKWYYRITVGILIICLIVFLYQAFIGGGNKQSSQSAASVPSLPDVSSVTNWFNGLGYKKTFTLVASDLKCQELKGVKPGKRKFSFPREVAFEQAVLSGRIKSEDNPQWRYVKIGPGDQRPTRKDIADHLRVNDTVPGEYLDVPEDGVVTICHAYPQWVRDKGIILGTTPGSDPTPIWIRIMFE